MRVCGLSVLVCAPLRRLDFEGLLPFCCPGETAIRTSFEAGNPLVIVAVERSDPDETLAGEHS